MTENLEPMSHVGSKGSEKTAEKGFAPTALTFIDGKVNWRCQKTKKSKGANVC